MAIWRLSGFTLCFMILSAFGLTFSGLYFFGVIKQPIFIISNPQINVTVSIPHTLNYNFYNESDEINETGTVHCGIVGFTYCNLTANGNIIQTFNFADPTFISFLTNIHQVITPEFLSIMMEFMSDSAYTNNGKNLSMILNASSAQLMNFFMLVCITLNGSVIPTTMMFELPDLVNATSIDFNLETAMLGQQTSDKALINFPSPATYSIQFESVNLYVNNTGVINYQYDNAEYMLNFATALF